MTEWTPGPWTADAKENCGPNGDWGVWHVESMGPICFVGDPYPRGDNRPYENMRLIARAPEMAALLQRLVDNGGGGNTGAGLIAEEARALLRELEEKP